jgi:hypothetical protein
MCGEEAGLLLSERGLEGVRKLEMQPSRAALNLRAGKTVEKVWLDQGFSRARETLGWAVAGRWRGFLAEASQSYALEALAI